MERYSGNQEMEVVQGDQVAEWAAPGGETGLEERMWQLGLGAGPELYPERPDEPDCIYYLRTGFCGYGNRCRFNHPPDRGTAIGALSAGGVEYPERAGQPVCQYYMRTGMCKFGASCKYHHPKHGVGSSAPAELNFYGYQFQPLSYIGPFLPGERECLYYLKTGQCKFGVTCKFHHPQPAAIQEPTSGPLPAPLAGPTPLPVQSSQQYGVIPAGNWSGANPAMLPGSYVSGSYGPMLLSSGVVPVPGWTPYTEYAVQPSVSHAASPSTQPITMFGVTQFSPSATAYTTGQYLPISSTVPLSSSSHKDHVFPERPGQPECQYYLRTGDCKFGSTCKYNHPPEWNVPRTNFLFSTTCLPLRPGAPLCSQYAQSGACRFGSSCKFDHSMRSSGSFLSYSPSASSLTDMPVAPYPVGSTNATSAPSSSSSDLKRGFSKDASSLQINTSSASSVGSILSTSQSSAQQSGQGLTSSRVGSSTSLGDGDIHTSR